MTDPQTTPAASELAVIAAYFGTDNPEQCKRDLVPIEDAVRATFAALSPTPQQGVEAVVERPFLGGKITPQEWLAGYASDDRKVKANARAAEGERIAAYITQLEARALSTDTQQPRDDGPQSQQETTMTNRITLGDKIKDSMTGIEGIAYGRSIYMTGCDHIGIKRTGVDPDGKPFDMHWVDEPLVVIVEKDAFALPDETARGSKTGGPSLHRHSK